MTDQAPFQSVRAWARARGVCVPEASGEGITVALVDDGVVRRIPPLRDAHVVARDFVRGGHGGAHGTLSASILVGRCEGYLGLVPDARLLAARVRGGRDGSAPLQAALRWLLRERPDVVCIPMGRPSSCPRTSALLRRLRDQGAQIVAAAGNRDPQQRLFPASSRHVTAVSALDDAGAVMPGCYGGDGARFAPGREVPAWGPDGPCTFSRTSAATTLVAGLEAAAISERGRQAS